MAVGKERRVLQHWLQEEFRTRFYRLQVEETLYSSLDSNLDPPNNESTRLGLDIPKDSILPTPTGGIVFSPGGSEAFVYPHQGLNKVRKVARLYFDWYRTKFVSVERNLRQPWSRLEFFLGSFTLGRTQFGKNLSLFKNFHLEPLRDINKPLPRHTEISWLWFI
jgi:hypothetical protein